MSEGTTNNTIWAIAKWTDVFETAESRRHRTLAWVSMPVGFSSSGYQSLLVEFSDDAPSIYGAWCALVGFAAQCPTRGILATSQGRPITWSHVARVTGFPTAVFERLFEWASHPSVAWLVPVEAPGNTGKEGLSGNASASPSLRPAVAQAKAGLQTDLTDLTNKTKQTKPTSQPALRAGSSSAKTNAIEGGRAGGSDFGDDLWDFVAERLAKLGASRWKPAIQAARANGCDSGDVEQIIAFGETNGFGVGAIVNRVSNAHPSLALEKGWPDRQEKAKALVAKRSPVDAKNAREAEATRIIVDGRKAKKDDDEILKELTSKGLEWPR